MSAKEISVKKYVVRLSGEERERQRTPSTSSERRACASAPTDDPHDLALGRPGSAAPGLWYYDRQGLDCGRKADPSDINDHAAMAEARLWRSCSVKPVGSRPRESISTFSSARRFNSRREQDVGAPSAQDDFIKAARVPLERDLPAAIAPATTAASHEEIAALVAGGRQLMVAGDIPNARLVLNKAAEAGNAAAALELGATYDPTFLQPAMTDMGDVRTARLWYEKARDLGSTEAAVRSLRTANAR
jgi:hypothetical protein